MPYLPPHRQIMDHETYGTGLFTQKRFVYVKGHYPSNQPIRPLRATLLYSLIIYVEIKYIGTMIGLEFEISQADTR